MRLSDHDILLALEQGRISLKPNPDLEDISGCTVDLHLGYGFRIPLSHPQGMIDLSSTSASEQIEKSMSDVYTIRPPKSFWIHPGELVLGATLEAVTLPCDLVGWLDGRSSLARLGLMVHLTAHRIDPGWSGEIVLEFFNAGKYPIGLYPTMPIAAISFETLSSPVLKPYYKREQAKYRNQQGPVVSRI